MKKKNTAQTLLEQQIQELLTPWPDPMSRTDFRKACHIGTRTSIYLLESGLVPCENNGKKTRCYKISKADVAAYLLRRLTEPEYYTPPSDWYKNYPQRKPPATSLIHSLNYAAISQQKLHSYLKKTTKGYPDVLTVSQIAQITGYRVHTVSRWCTEKRVKSFMICNRYMVPKAWLLDFLTSEEYNNITRKSKKHYAMIGAVAPKPRSPRKKG